MSFLTNLILPLSLLPVMWKQIRNLIGIVHISAEHICVQVLCQLERPVLAFAIIIVKVNTRFIRYYENSESGSDAPCDGLLRTYYLQEFCRCREALPS